jgi:hypothetical protein
MHVMTTSLRDGSRRILHGDGDGDGGDDDDDGADSDGPSGCCAAGPAASRAASSASRRVLPKGSQLEDMATDVPGLEGELLVGHRLE